MKKVCKHCNEEIEFDKPQSFGAHITNCKFNPSREEIRSKIIKNKILERYIYKFNCKYCNREYELKLKESEFKTNRYKKCCSKYCANKISLLNIDIEKKANCINCNKDINIKINASYKNCLCEYCYNDRLKNKKVKNKVTKNKIIKECGEIVCKYCGSKKCLDTKICKSWMSGRSKIFIKFGFDINKIGSLDFYVEYNRIIELLKEEYKNNSLVEIGEKYKVNYQTVYMIFKNLGLKSRSLRDSNILAFKKGRYDLSEINIYPYKSGYHTSWENKTFWVRSSYELDYCKKLDGEKIRYDVEKIRLQYFDTKSNCERTCIPDFYLIDSNELVEIKSSWTYDEQNMKDKAISYKKNGYNFKLILDKKEIKFYEKY